MFPGSLFGAKLALIASLSFIPLDCSGSFRVSDQRSGCIEVVGGEVKWSVSGGVFKVDGDGTALTVRRKNTPECAECWIKGTMTVHIDANGNGVVDLGETVLENKVDTSNGGPLDGSIAIGGVQINSVSDSLRFIVTYRFEDCYGNVVTRSVSASP